METKTIKATLTMGANKKLTLRLYGMKPKDLETFILEKGVQPENMINIVVV